MQSMYRTPLELAVTDGPPDTDVYLGPSRVKGDNDTTGNVAGEDGRVVVYNPTQHGHVYLPSAQGEMIFRALVGGLKEAGWRIFGTVSQGTYQAEYLKSVRARVATTSRGVVGVATAFAGATTPSVLVISNTRGYLHIDPDADDFRPIPAFEQVRTFARTAPRESGKVIICMDSSHYFDDDEHEIVDVFALGGSPFVEFDGPPAYTDRTHAVVYEYPADDETGETPLLSEFYPR